MKIYSILLKAEFRRFWTPAMIVTAIGVIGIGDMMAFGMGTMKQIPKASMLVEMCYSITSFFAVLLFSAGIVGTDVKDGWLRTLLIRPITRQQYVLTKIAVVISAALMTLTLTIVIPLIYFTSIAETKIVFDMYVTLQFLLLKSGEIILFVSIAAFISCWITGAFNSLAMYIWFGASQMIEMVIAQKYWNVPWAMTVKDYLSPSGFENAIGQIKLGTAFPTGDIVWGVGAIAFFIALTLFSINQIQIDTGSE